MSMLNRMPYIPTAEEVEEVKGVDLSSNWVDMRIDYPAPRFLLEYQGVGFSPLGGIQALTGQKKNGKTFTIAQLMAAVLDGGMESERMKSKLPGLRARRETLDAIGAPPVVLFVDTEQEIENTVQVARRVHWLIGHDMQQPHERFRVLWLRAEKSPQERWLKTRRAILDTRPTAIFLDGIRDIVSDFNDNAESASIIAQCMKIANDYDCCLWCVLHANPTSDVKNEKMRGHLGTELGNKVSDIFSTKKTKKADGTATFTVTQKDARGKDVPDWSFVVTDDDPTSHFIGIPRICEAAAPAVPPHDLLTPETVEAIRSILSNGLSLRWTDIARKMKESTGVSKDTFGKVMSQACTNKLIERFDDCGVTKYRLMPATAAKTDQTDQDECPF